MLQFTGATLEGLFTAAAREVGAAAGSLRLTVDGRRLAPEAAADSLPNLSVVVVEASEFQSAPATTIPAAPLGSASADPCAICLEGFSADVPAIRAGSACSHAFHAPCLHEWMARSHFCPLCRAPMGGGSAVAVSEQHYDAPSCGGSVRGGAGVGLAAAGGVVGGVAGGVALGAGAAAAGPPMAHDIGAMIEAVRARVRANPEWRRLVSALQSPGSAAMATAAVGAAAAVAMSAGPGMLLRGAASAAIRAAPLVGAMASTAASVVTSAAATSMMSAAASHAAAAMPQHQMQQAGAVLAGAAATAGASMLSAAARAIPADVAMSMAMRGLSHGGSGGAGMALAGLALASGAGGIIVNELAGGMGDPNVRICPRCREKLHLPPGQSPTFMCGACGHICRRQ